jgi:hypothetical protein
VNVIFEVSGTLYPLDERAATVTGEDLRRKAAGQLGDEGVEGARDVADEIERVLSVRAPNQFQLARARADAVFYVLNVSVRPNESEPTRWPSTPLFARSTTSVCARPSRPGARAKWFVLTSAASSSPTSRESCASRVFTDEDRRKAAAHTNEIRRRRSEMVALAQVTQEIERRVAVAEARRVRKREKQRARRALLREQAPAVVSDQDRITIWLERGYGARV